GKLTQRPNHQGGIRIRTSVNGPPGQHGRNTNRRANHTDRRRRTTRNRNRRGSSTDQRGHHSRLTPLVRAAASSIPVSGGAPSPVRVVCSPVRISSVLSPGPIYRGPDPDPSLVVWPLSEFPDWPINDDWRDFAFEPVVFRSPVFSSEQSNDNNSDHDGP